MNDADFIKAMQLGLPPIRPPTTHGLAVTEHRMDDVLLGNADIEISNHEAINGICAGEQSDG